MNLTFEQVTALAPDASAAAAAKQLATPANWRGLGRNADALWGECQGTALYLERVAEGLEALDLWMSDLVHNGLAGVESQGSQMWEAQAARLVDAQAPAFAALGIPTFACTPDLFPELMAAAFQKRDLGLWAARHDIVAVRGAP